MATLANDGRITMVGEPAKAHVGWLLKTELRLLDGGLLRTIDGIGHFTADDELLTNDGVRLRVNDTGSLTVEHLAQEDATDHARLHFSVSSVGDRRAALLLAWARLIWQPVRLSQPGPLR